MDECASVLVRNERDMIATGADVQSLTPLLTPRPLVYRHLLFGVFLYLSAPRTQRHAFLHGLLSLVLEHFMSDEQMTNTQHARSFNPVWAAVLTLLDSLLRLSPSSSPILATGECLESCLDLFDCYLTQKSSVSYGSSSASAPSPSSSSASSMPRPLAEALHLLERMRDVYSTQGVDTVCNTDHIVYFSKLHTEYERFVQVMRRLKELECM
jgi:hypothetical protein